MARGQKFLTEGKTLSNVKAPPGRGKPDVRPGPQGPPPGAPRKHVTIKVEVTLKDEANL